MALKYHPITIPAMVKSLKMHLKKNAKHPIADMELQEKKTLAACNDINKTLASHSLVVYNR